MKNTTLLYTAYLMLVFLSCIVFYQYSVSFISLFALLNLVGVVGHLLHYILIGSKNEKENKPISLSDKVKRYADHFGMVALYGFVWFLAPSYIIAIIVGFFL